jgi:KipI family sensor histidine kinase inhibitor
VLVELAGLDEVLAVHRALARARSGATAPALEDLVPAERTLLVRFDPHRTSCDEVREWVAGVPPEPEAPDAAGELLELPVVYDGADLDDVGRLTGLGGDGVVAAHTGTPWTVAFTGFAPGFGYLTGGDPRLVVPRLATPRVRVPAGSVALAGAYSGVYPQESPGGWRIVGTTTERVWDLDRDPPGLLRPGLSVRFVAVEQR